MLYELKNEHASGLTSDGLLVAKALVTYHCNSGLNYDQAITKAKTALEVSGLDYHDGSWHSTNERQTDHAVITKANEDKRLVFGWANVIATTDDKLVFDRQKDFIDNEWEIEKSAYNYMLKCREGGAEHVVTGVGKAVESMVFTQEKKKAMGIPDGTLPTGWWIGFHVNDDDCWDLVKSGKFTGFSVHGKGMRTPVKKV